MSYCRFENTYRDLMDCIQALSDNGANDLTDRELGYAERMMTLCQEMLVHEDDVLDEMKDRLREQAQHI